MLKSLIFMQLPEVPIENLLRIFHQFPTLSVSLNFIISDLGDRGKRGEENNHVKCLEGGPQRCYVLVATAEGSGKSFKQPPQLQGSRVGAIDCFFLFDIS